MEKIKDNLIELYLLPTIPFRLFFSILYISLEIERQGLIDFSVNGIDKEHFEDFKYRHYPPLFQRILSLVLWILIIIHYI